MNPYNSIYAAFRHPEFSTYADFSFVLGGACALAYKKHSNQKKQKLAYWKPSLSIRKQNRSHLQDLYNAFLTKDRARYLSQSQGNLHHSASFCYKRKTKTF